MAHLITGVGEDVIHASTHGMMDSSDLRFLRDRTDRFMNSASGVVSKYFASAKAALDRIDLSALRERVTGLRDRFDLRDDPDRVSLIVDLGGFQQAKSKQRRLLMSHPRLRNLYHQGRASGYEGLYEDEEPGKVGRDHTDYREVYTGSYVGDEENGDAFVFYYGADDDEGELVHGVKARHTTRYNHETVDLILDQGQMDPSSQLGKTL